VGREVKNPKELRTEETGLTTSSVSWFLVFFEGARGVGRPAEKTDEKVEASTFNRHAACVHRRNIRILDSGFHGEDVE